jgi:hypothetical protein
MRGKLILMVDKRNRQSSNMLALLEAFYKAQHVFINLLGDVEFRAVIQSLSFFM